MLGSLSAKHLDPNQVTVQKLETILNNVTRVGACWIHNGKHHTGYRYARIKQIKYPIHRIVKVAATGRPIPANMVIDHLCRNRACINHKHLDIVTQSVNAKRGETGNWLTTEVARSLQVLSVLAKKQV